MQEKTLVIEYLVVGAAPPLARQAEAVADLRPFYARYGHERGAQCRVQPAVRLRVRAETGWYAEDGDLERAAQRVSLRGRLVNLLYHGG